MLLLRLQWSLVAFILFIILVDLGNKLGIGQDKDASRSSRQFADIYLLLLDNLAHSRLDFFCCTLNFNFSINCLFYLSCMPRSAMAESVQTKFCTLTPRSWRSNIFGPEIKIGLEISEVRGCGIWSLQLTFGLASITAYCTASAYAWFWLFSRSHIFWCFVDDVIVQRCLLFFHVFMYYFIFIVCFI